LPGGAVAVVDQQGVEPDRTPLGLERGHAPPDLVSVPGRQGPAIDDARLGHGASYLAWGHYAGRTMARNDEPARIAELRDLLTRANRAYYVDADPIMSDT